MKAVGVDVQLAIVATCPPGERFVHRLVCRAWSGAPRHRPTGHAVARSVERIRWVRSIGQGLLDVLDGGKLGWTVAWSAARSGDWGRVEALCGGYRFDHATHTLMRWAGRADLARASPDWAAFTAGLGRFAVAPPLEYADAWREVVKLSFAHPDLAGVCADVTWRGAADQLWRAGDGWVARWPLNRGYEGVGRFRSTGAQSLTIVLERGSVEVRLPAGDLVLPADALRLTQVTVEARFDAPRDWDLTATCWLLRWEHREAIRARPFTLGPLLISRDEVAADVRRDPPGR